MYKCKTCKAVVPTGTLRMVHQIKRTDGSIARELEVCRLCHDSLRSGTSVANLLHEAKPPENVEVPTRVASATGDE